jgi:hypothetical protein
VFGCILYIQDIRIKKEIKMVGAKIPVLEVEDYLVTKDGRGIILHNDGKNVLLGRNWTGIPPSSNSPKTKCFPAISSSGWVGISIISGSTYGPTGATYYIPIYSNVNTNLSI